MSFMAYCCNISVLEAYSLTLTGNFFVINTLLLVICLFVQELLLSLMLPMYNQALAKLKTDKYLGEIDHIYNLK